LASSGGGETQYCRERKEGKTEAKDKRKEGRREGRKGNQDTTLEEGTRKFDNICYIIRQRERKGGRGIC
jgi:hypothetical protein